ncbi:hypothetical protein [Streptomyces sp. NPDC018031]|uniref:hypothetical protein n=1 Tax=Streptomyces sp. NPDC018031 TaxID=3365033 RepID=UPI00379931FB
MSKGWHWLLLGAFVVWTLFALEWQDLGCDIPESYLAVLTRGTPEGLEFLPACHG